MTDERGDETSGEEQGDGLDAWLAAHFPPKAEEEKPQTPQAPSVPPVDEGLPGAPEPPELVEPPVAPGPTGLPTVASWVLPAEDPPVPPVLDASLPGLRASSGFPPEPDGPAGPTEAFGTVGEASALDDLFGEAKFRDYEVDPGPTENPFVQKAIAIDSSPVTVPQTPVEGISKTQRVLLWVAGSVVAALALGALFLVGTKLPDLLGPAPAVVATPSTTPTPTPTVAAIGPVEPGEYRWDELLGGECLDPYTGPWAEDFTVVDCTLPHPAQVVARGLFADVTDPSAPPAAGTPGSNYPGIEALQAQINLLCSAPTVIDYAVAGTYTDIQFEASYPATEQQWADGDRAYFCFVSRKSGEPLTGTISVPQVAPAPIP